MFLGKQAQIDADYSFYNKIGLAIAASYFLPLPLFIFVTLSSADMIRDERSPSTRFQIESQTNAMIGR